MSYHQWGAQDLSTPARTVLQKVEAQPGVVLEDVQSGFVGEILRTEKSGGMHVMILEDRKGKRRTFPLGFGFHVDGTPVEVVPALQRSVAPSNRTASGSVRVADQRARVALSSRIWVEGRHDAELVEKVWGDDLRVEGIVVEPLHGVDDLASAVRGFRPAPGRRLGILVDHLVDGSKEARIAAEAMAVPGAAGNVLIVGHPYVDVWQAVKPRALGLEAWPVIPRNEEWKVGILSRLGWPHQTQADIAAGWKRILGGVTTYADLEPSLLGRVEEVIDFLTAPEDVRST
ncbi:DUF3097 family protein [Arthrobacter sp. JZ12]|uniref:DUF3097 domain-containing protein n=1 Tax=Arthrobacter sp. JZ12 TaxID=2654190 RepID=UPI002B469E4C|nr:DUF3097 domain-containing protein [Arthrobacter sp. JZ12]WRH25004.1 DUF3097 family protein [Arthrobacter sp. JZ12]